MPSDFRRSALESRPRAWVFRAPGAGDNGQLAALVELANLDARWIDRVDPVIRVLRERFGDRRGRAIPPDKRDTFKPPWPDLVLIAGGRSVTDARRVRAASNGSTRIVAVGRPWAPLGWFDLVITTPQYRLPSGANILHLDLPLNRPAVPDRAALTAARADWDRLPTPWLGVMLGGHSGTYRFTPQAAQELGAAVNRAAAGAGGSVIAVDSPRTPPKARRAFAAAISAPSRVYSWNGAGPNRYPLLLALADALVVTADSASMIAEACRAGPPVAIYPLPERPRARAVRWLGAAPIPPASWRPALTRAGLWVPARDLSRLHTAALKRPHVVGLESVLSAEVSPHTPDDPDIAAVTAALQRLAAAH